MYTTLQINAESNSFDRVETVPPFRLACVNCRAKKLKCTGETNGCERCLSRGFTCQYLAVADKGSRNKYNDAAKSNGAGVFKAKSRSGSINNHAKDGGKNTTAPAPPVNAHPPRPSVQREMPEPEASEPQQPLANRQIPSTASAGLEGGTSHSPAAANRFVMEGNATFPGATLFDPDIDMFNTEVGLGADVWEDLNSTAIFGSPRLDNLADSTAPTPTRGGSSSANTDTLYQRDFSSRTSGSHVPDFDSSFLYSFDIPLASPTSKDIRTESSQGHRQASLTRSDQTAYPRDAALDACSSGMERQINDTFLSSEPCGCVKLALSMLEAISVPTVSIKRPEISRMLYLGKHILARCKQLLSCERCRTSSSFVVLLLTISKSLVEAYERVLELLVEQFNEQHSTQLEPARASSFSQQHFSSVRQRGVSNLPPRPQAQAQAHPRGNDDRNAGRGLDHGNLHGYEFDVEEEPAVFGGVTRLQLSLLLTFLLNVRNVLQHFKWDSHLLRVEETSERIKTQLALFGTRPGRIFDGQ